MKELNIKEKHEYLIKILKVFVDFCENNNIKYFVSSGTCLGAVRHKGFIPWDDDIDILVPREDYEKLINLFNDEKYRIYHHSKDKKYTFPFAKLCDESVVVRETNIKLKHSLYIYVDIFPLDVLSNDPKTNNKLVKKISFYKKILDHKVKEKYPSKRFLHTLAKVFSIFFSFKMILRKMDKLAAKYKGKDSLYCMDTIWGNKILESRFFDGYKYLQFEGVSVRVPGKTDEYLKTLYGNYMELPPEHKRGGHGFLAYKNEKKNDE